jgi:hypothetical protein
MHTALCCRRHTALVRILLVWRHDRRGADKSALFPCHFLIEYAHLPRQARDKDEESPNNHGRFCRRFYRNREIPCGRLATGAETPFMPSRFLMIRCRLPRQARDKRKRLALS